MAFFGLHTLSTLKRFNIQSLFFSCRGIDMQRGLSEANDRHAAVKLGMIESARSKVLLADTSKLGVASTVFVTPVDTADHVILEQSDDPAVLQAVEHLHQRNLRITQAEVHP